MAKRLIPRTKRRDEGTFTAADRAKLNSIEFGANLFGGGFPDLEEDNVPVSTSEGVFNFSGHVELTDQGFQTDIVIPLDLDGGLF